jgi:hypothetical protein
LSAFNEGAVFQHPVKPKRPLGQWAADPWQPF